jgi:hypothetical protein
VRFPDYYPRRKQDLCDLYQDDLTCASNITKFTATPSRKKQSNRGLLVCTGLGTIRRNDHVSQIVSVSVCDYVLGRHGQAPDADRDKESGQG